jgi:heme/copper-type cytochrome/quinol oxidase subunit 2
LAKYPRGRISLAASAAARRFQQPADATKELHDHFNAWTGGLSSYALQVTFALIGANWALHGSQIFDDRWATLSMTVAILYLAIRLVLYGAMVLVTWYRHRYADADKQRWAQEFHESADKESAWPYSRWNDIIGATLHWLHVILPLTCGVLLLVSISPNLCFHDGC